MFLANLFLYNLVWKASDTTELYFQLIVSRLALILDDLSEKRVIVERSSSVFKNVITIICCFKPNKVYGRVTGLKQ